MAKPVIDVDPIPRDMLDAKLRGPRDERREASSLAVKHVSESARELMQSGAITPLQALATRSNPLYDRVKRRLRVREQRRRMAKSMNAEIDTRQRVTFETIHQPGMAMADADVTRYGTTPPIYLERPVGLGFNQLREIVRQDVQLDLIVNTRIAQTLRYMKPAKFEWQPGFRLSFVDENRERDDDDDERFRLIARYLLACGMETNPRRRRALKRDDLRGFTIKHLRDSLTMDAAPIELIPTAEGRTHGWVAVDGASIYLTDPTWGLLDSGHEATPDLNKLMHRLHISDPSDVIAVRNVEGHITAHYSDLDMLYPVRNLGADERRFGYGDAEPEIVLKMVTGFLNAMTYNNRALDDNSVPPGILVLHGDFEDDDLEFLKNDWMSEISGAGNRHRLPVMVSQDGNVGGVEFVNTGQQISDVSYAKWISLLTAIKCSRYLMDPTEISFESYYSGNSSPLNAGSDTQERIVASQDKGLHSILDWYGSTLNEIVQELDPEVRLDWTGLDVSKEEALQREKDLLTWGELRQKYAISVTDMPDELLETPLNPQLGSIYSQIFQAKQQEKMMQQQGGMPGEDGAEAAGPGGAAGGGQQPQPTGEDRDVDGDGRDEYGVDMTGDGQTDAWATLDEDGNPIFLDADGNAWRGDANGERDDEDPDFPRRMEKAAQVNLFEPYDDPRRP